MDGYVLTGGADGRVMAELVIPEGYGLAKLSWQMAGKPAPVTVTLGYAAVLTPPADCAQAIYEYAINDGSIADEDNMVNSYTFLGVEVHQNVGGDIMGAAYGTPIEGAGGPGSLPPINCTLLASKKTALVGRKFQGRMYLPNMIIGEADIDAMGNLSTVVQPLWQSMVDIFCNGPTAIPGPGYLTGDPPWGVILHSDATTPTVITSMVARLQLATQRRRMR